MDYWGLPAIAARMQVSPETICRWRRDLLFPVLRRHKVVPSRSGLRHRLRVCSWSSDDLILRWLERRSLAHWIADRQQIPSPLQSFLAMGSLPLSASPGLLEKVKRIVRLAISSENRQQTGSQEIRGTGRPSHRLHLRDGHSARRECAMRPSQTVTTG